MGSLTLKSPGKCEEIATEGAPAAKVGAVFYFRDEQPVGRWMRFIPERVVLPTCSSLVRYERLFCHSRLMGVVLLRFMSDCKLAHGFCGFFKKILFIYF